MSDASTGNPPPPPPDSAPSGRNGEGPPPHPPFPVVRLLYAVGYGFIAWFVLHILFLLAVVQFVVLALNGRPNEELKQFCLTLVQYLWELLAFMTFVRDEQPFPFGPFPRHA